jgi:hypothetical protein
MAKADVGELLCDMRSTAAKPGNSNPCTVDEGLRVRPQE